MSKTVGYARVSTREQNLDRQIKALEQYVDHDMIVVDKASGKDLERPGYQITIPSFHSKLKSALRPVSLSTFMMSPLTFLIVT